MVGAWTGDAIPKALATQVLRAHWASRPHCTRYLAGLPARPTRGATPAKHHVAAGLASPSISRRGTGPPIRCQVWREVGPRRASPGTLVAGLVGKTAISKIAWSFAKVRWSGTTNPWSPAKIPCSSSREFAAKPLIVRPEVRAGFAEQAIFGENSL